MFYSAFPWAPSGKRAPDAKLAFWISLTSAPLMARRSLRPNLNQIRTWVRQGRTDAWIAHQLEVTVQQIETFKRENDLERDDVSDAPSAVDFDDEIDLRAEDDALIAAELEAEQARAEAAAVEDDGDEDREDADDEGEGEARPRRRGRRGRGGRRTGSTARGASSALEGTFDHGEEGYGLWLDPAIEDNPVYAEHWAGHRPVEVTVEADRIVIRRAQADGGDEDDE
jgi:5-methylcytosine-specific restriction endonuclease McrA